MKYGCNVWRYSVYLQADFSWENCRRTSIILYILIIVLTNNFSVNLQAVVVGYFNFTRLDRTPGYREFYKAAIRSLERDPNRELVFAIVTSASSSKLHYGVYKFPSASLLMWNESLVSMQCMNLFTLYFTYYISFTNTSELPGR